MKKISPKRRKPRKPRDLNALAMILAGKGGPMRDRRERRAGEDRRAACNPEED